MFYRRLSITVVAGFAAVSASLASGAALAQDGVPQFDTLYVYGDSSSDNGNFYAAFGAQMHPTFGLYYSGAFTNGAVWGDYLVEMGVAAIQDNRAYAGAMTNAYGEPSRIPNATSLLPTGLATQTQCAPGEFGENDLVGVWVGFNDYLFGGLFGFDNAPATVVGNIADAVGRLNGCGARHIMLFNLPDLSRVPLASLIAPDQAIKLGTASAVHNALLASAVARLNLQLEAEVAVVNIFAAMSQIVGYPERFGFTNATDACIAVVNGTVSVPNPYSPCYGGDGDTQYDPYDQMSPAGFVFWDPLHPAAATHRLLAEFTAATLAANAFGTATMGAANGTSTAAGVVYMCNDQADGNWCY